MNHFIHKSVFSLVIGLGCSSALAGTQIKFLNQTVTPEKSIAVRSRAHVGADDYVIQFKNAITESDKSSLRAAGISVFRYVPDDALIVRGTYEQLQTFAQNSRVNGFIPFKGAMKVSPALPPVSVFARVRALDAVIFTFTEADKNQIIDFIKKADPQTFFYDVAGKSISAKINQGLLHQISEMTGVEYVQELVRMEPMHILLDDGQTPPPDDSQMKGDYTDLTGFETGTKVMNMDAAWNAGFKGQGQIVGMADTGLDNGMIESIAPDFQGAVLKGFGFGIGAKGGWSDPMGHGTHVAGSVLGRGTASHGLLKGAAHEAQLIAEGMWSPIINNLTVPSKLINLFKNAYDNGARIHTNSWGSGQAATFGSYEGMAQQVDQFMWDNPDMLVVFAAGNSGVDMDKDGRIDPISVGPPGTAKNILTVGASENVVEKGGIQKPIKDLRNAADIWGAEPIFSSKISDDANGMAMFSSRGPTKDRRLKPEISAPGTNILSTRSHDPKAEPLWGEYSADYVWSGGTSMATPLTAGAAAVTRQMLIEKFGITKPSAALVKAALIHTAYDMFPGQYGLRNQGQELLTRRPNNDEGYGRVDMAKMVSLSNATHFVDSEVEQAKTVVLPLTIQKGMVLANLVYTDSPGTPSAGAALVNDLDLQLVAQDGTVVSSPNDRINNNEIIEMSKLAPGNYQLIVKGVKIPMGKNGKQPFALVYTAE